MVHGIVKSHGGKIVVRSELGKGSTFDLFFPRIEGVEDYKEKQIEAPPAGNERILLVDDEEMVVAVASEMLLALGYEVVSVQRSSDALALFRSQPDRFHLLITDQTMPVMTGVELATEVLRIRRDIPIILCTGFSDDTVYIANNYFFLISTIDQGRSIVPSLHAGKRARLPVRRNGWTNRRTKTTSMELITPLGCNSGEWPIRKYPYKGQRARTWGCRYNPNAIRFRCPELLPCKAYSLYFFRRRRFFV